MVGFVSLVAGLRRTLPIPRQEGADDVQARLDDELGRARRYGGSVSAISVQAVSRNGGDDASWQHFTSTLTESLRTFDTCWAQSDRIVVVLPHTDLTARSHVIERILRQADSERVEIEVSAATFPTDAPTSDALLASLADRRRLAS